MKHYFETDYSSQDQKVITKKVILKYISNYLKTLHLSSYPCNTKKNTLSQFTKLLHVHILQNQFLIIYHRFPGYRSRSIATAFSLIAPGSWPIDFHCTERFAVASRAKQSRGAFSPRCSCKDASSMKFQSRYGSIKSLQMMANEERTGGGPSLMERKRARPLFRTSKTKETDVFGSGRF